MNSKYSGSLLTTFTSGIGASSSLEELGAAIDRFSEAADYQILHFGVCKIDNTVIKDVIYSRPVTGTAMEVKDFRDDLKVMACNEALSLMKPFDLTRHEFQTCDTAHFDDLRKGASAAGIDGIIVIPYKHETTISVVIIRCAYEKFLVNISDVLPHIYTLIAKTFARFPTLAKWPDEYRLTDREAEILQISAIGARESDVAAQLGISIYTVRAHVENAKRKLDARNKAHAIMIAAHASEINPATDVERR